MSAFVSAVSSSTMSRRCGVQLSEVDLVDVEVWDRHASRAKTATRACDPVVKQDLAAPRPSLLRPQGAGAGGCYSSTPGSSCRLGCRNRRTSRCSTSMPR